MSEEWTVVRELGRGGFGVVYEVSNGLESRALKVIASAFSTWRDLLVNEVPDGPWAIPILEAAEVNGDALLLMPLAEMSLRQRMSRPVDAKSDLIEILVDLAAALAALEAVGLVHRDVKPENVLLHDGAWKLTDFGEARYADATTGLSTHRLHMTPAYAGPERWLEERATIRADVYSWGVIAFELLIGSRPFSGSREELRQQHLADPPPPMSGVDAALASLVKLTLSKRPETRPSAAELVRRIQGLNSRSNLPGFRDLAEASAQIADTMAQESVVEAQRRLRVSRHEGLFESATILLSDLAVTFKNLILDNSVVALESDPGVDLFKISIGSAQLSMSAPRQAPLDPWGDQLAPFEVVAFADIRLDASIRFNNSPRGRAHSLWFGDIQRRGEFEWYEVAFHVSRAFPDSDDGVLPQGIDLDRKMAGLFLDTYFDVSLSRPFVRFTFETLEEAAANWAGWIAQASVGPLVRPSLPEVHGGGSWRRQGQDSVR